MELTIACKNGSKSIRHPLALAGHSSKRESERVSLERKRKRKRRGEKKEEKGRRGKKILEFKVHLALFLKIER